MLIASTKVWNERGASHQPAFINRCLTISHTCLPCLPSKWICPCVLYSSMIDLMVASLTFFVHGEYGFSSTWSWRKWVWNSRIKLCCITPGKCNVSRVSLQHTSQLLTWLLITRVCPAYLIDKLAFNYYYNELYLGCCSSPRYVSGNHI